MPRTKKTLGFTTMRFVSYHLPPYKILSSLIVCPPITFIDLLKGDIFQVNNQYIKKFEEKKYDEIPTIIDSLTEVELIIEVDDNIWIPHLFFKKEWDLEKKIKLPLTLEIDEGVDWERVKSLFYNVDIREVLYFGQYYPGNVFPGVPLYKQQKDFSKCISRASCMGQFSKIDESFYHWHLARI